VNSPSMVGEFALTEDQILEIRKVFNLFSKGKGGAIKLDQLGQVLRAAGGVPTEKEIDNAIAPFNSEDKTSITFSEFSEILQQHRIRHGFLEQELREAFETFDEDCDGYIDTTELIKVLTVLGDPLTEKEADELVREADLNGDGKINYIEFVGMTCKPK